MFSNPPIRVGGGNSSTSPRGQYQTLELPNQTKLGYGYRSDTIMRMCLLRHKQQQL